MNLPYNTYINVIRDVANVSEEHAENIYYELKAQMHESDELSGLIETEIKQNKK